MNFGFLYYTKIMKRWYVWRKALLAVGIALCLLGIAAEIYALSARETVVERVRVEPTLFYAPGAKP